jgi:hypothetical protein
MGADGLLRGQGEFAAADLQDGRPCGEAPASASRLVSASAPRRIPGEDSGGQVETAVLLHEMASPDAVVGLVGRTRNVLDQESVRAPEDWIAGSENGQERSSASARRSRRG